MGQESAEQDQAARIVLARVSGFRIGVLEVEPGTRQVSAAGQSETLEPRVMQVLVVLASANGRVVSRDELIERCWEGRIVTDDAINRVIARIRHLASGIGRESFGIETIAKVGYRLVPAVSSRVILPFPGTAQPDLAPQGPAGKPIGRRALIGGAAALAVAGSSGLLWWAPWRHRVSAESQALTRRGQAMVREGLPGQLRQAVTYYEKAVAADPRNAEAWGELSLSYSHMLNGFDPAETASLPDRIRSAAAKAEALDPGNGNARLAILSMTPAFGRWAEKERALRAIIADHPRHWLAHGRLAMLLYDVGRVSEGAEMHGKALAIDPMLPIARAMRIWALGALGRIQEADAEMDLANGRWPGNPMVWSNSFHHLLTSKRAESAAAYVRDPRVRPMGMPPLVMEIAARLADAVARRDPKLTAASQAEHRALLKADPFAAPAVAKALALLGAVDEALEVLRFYLLGPALNPQLSRTTNLLFAPPFKDLASDPRHAALTKGTGLAAYWRKTGSLPDA